MNYGRLRLSKSVRVEALQPMFASLDCRPRYDLGLRKGGADDTGPSSQIVKGLLKVGDRARAAFSIDTRLATS